MNASQASLSGIDLRRAVDLLRNGQLDEAGDLLEHFLLTNPQHFDACQLMGVLHHQRGEYESAIHVLQKAVALNSKVAATHNNLGTSLAAIGLHSQAEQAYRRALEIEPANIGFRQNLANVLVSLEQFESAAKEIELALVQAPGNEDLMRSLRGLSQRAGKKAVSALPTDAAANESQSCSGPATNDNDFWASIEAAKNLRREGGVDQAVEILTNLLDSTSAPDHRRSLLFLLASMLDESGRYDRAFEALQEANEIAATQDGEHASATRYLADVAAHRGIGALMAASQAEASEPGREPHQPPSPAFVVGFPRSGTTLLAQMLDSHPTLTALQEAPMLESLRKDVFCLPAGYPQALARLTDRDREQLKAAYFREAAKFRTFDAGTQLVDVSATHLRYVPLIRSVFPQAPILLIIRHPADVCLSCLMKDFKANDLVANFHSLQAAAIAYRDTMELTESYAELCPGLSEPVRYESLVENPSQQLKVVCRQLGCEYDDAMLGFHESARRTTIRTASHDQVTRPLYVSSINRWKRYASQIESIKPILAPWIQHWGYDA